MFWAVARVFKGVARVVARVSCMVELNSITLLKLVF